MHTYFALDSLFLFLSFSLFNPCLFNTPQRGFPDRRMSGAALRTVTWNRTDYYWDKIVFLWLIKIGIFESPCLCVVYGTCASRDNDSISGTASEWLVCGVLFSSILGINKIGGEGQYARMAQLHLEAVVCHGLPYTLSHRTTRIVTANNNNKKRITNKQKMSWHCSIKIKPSAHAIIVSWSLVDCRSFRLHIGRCAFGKLVWYPPKNHWPKSPMPNATRSISSTCDQKRRRWFRTIGRI